MVKSANLLLKILRKQKLNQMAGSENGLRYQKLVNI